MKSRRIVLLLLAVFLTGCNTTSPKKRHSSSSHTTTSTTRPTSGTSSTTDTSSTGSSTSSGGVDPELDAIPVNFTAINDFHGQVDEEAGDYRVGLAKMTTYLKDRKAAGDVLLCSGDNYQGSYQCFDDKGKLVSETFKLFSKNLLMVIRVSSSKSSGLLPSNISFMNILHRGIGSW